MDLDFKAKLALARQSSGGPLCVGLDYDPARLPSALRAESDPIFAFNRAIIEATHDLVCAYKPNIAFYEAMGLPGLKALLRTRDFIAERAPHIPVILDAKRGDIGNTAQAYATAVFDNWGFDGLTVNPYMGKDALDPFLQRTDRGIFVLAKTSNPGAADFQDLLVNEHPLYVEVILKSLKWAAANLPNLCFVAGATYPAELAHIRQLAPEQTLLIPGVGSQGGSARETLKAAIGPAGEGIIVSVSRHILYPNLLAGEDFTQATRRNALRIKAELS